VHASGETLQDFAAAVEPLANRALVGLSAAFAQTESTQSFMHGIRDREVKQHLLLEDDRTLNEAFNQALNLEVAKAALTAKPREFTEMPARASQPPDRRRVGRPLCWQCVSAGHLPRD